MCVGSLSRLSEKLFNLKASAGRSCGPPTTVKETPDWLKSRRRNDLRARQDVRHGTHEAALDLRLVSGLGAEIVLSIDNELRRARFYWRTQMLEMPAAIMATETNLATRGWANADQP